MKKSELRTTQANCRMKQSLKDKLLKHCENTGLTESRVIEQLLEKLLDEKYPKLKVK